MSTNRFESERERYSELVMRMLRQHSSFIVIVNNSLDDFRRGSFALVSYMKLLTYFPYENVHDDSVWFLSLHLFHNVTYFHATIRNINQPTVCVFKAGSIKLNCRLFFKLFLSMSHNSNWNSFSEFLCIRGINCRPWW